MHYIKSDEILSNFCTVNFLSNFDLIWKKPSKFWILWVISG